MIVHHGYIISKVLLNKNLFSLINFSIGIIIGVIYKYITYFTDSKDIHIALDYCHADFWMARDAENDV